MANDAADAHHCKYRHRAVGPVTGVMCQSGTPICQRPECAIPSPPAAWAIAPPHAEGQQPRETCINVSAGGRHHPHPRKAASGRKARSATSAHEGRLRPDPTGRHRPGRKIPEWRSRPKPGVSVSSRLSPPPMHLPCVHAVCKLHPCILVVLTCGNSRTALCLHTPKDTPGQQR